MPTLYIIAGPNGVGKTTFADRYLPEEIKQLEFVNVDLIARGLSPYDADSVSIEAGRVAVERIRHLIRGQQSFTWESTMSGRTAIRWIQAAKQSGYLIKCYFLWVEELEMTIRRIRQRVSEGGHKIDREVSQRRFFKSIQNFFSMYRQLCDTWKLIANDDDFPRLLAFEKDGRIAIRDRKAIEKIVSRTGIIL